MASEEVANVGQDDSPKAHYGKITDTRLTADEMDMRRRENVAYEYLCHLEEAKVWIEACINEELPPTTELEEGLRNGVHLGKLGHFMAPEKVPLKKIYDKDLSRYNARGLHFRHTDNINHFIKGMDSVGLPSIFYPETTDIYDRKNMPRTIYCIHALSLYLFKLGKAPQIQDLYGKIKFTDDEINAMRLELEKYGIQMPAFSKIGGILATEMPVDEAALHAAVIAINDAIDKQVPKDTVKALENPAAHLNNIRPQYAETYQQVMYNAKFNKAEIARNKSLDPDSSYVPDVYDELLTQAELQGNINKINTDCALHDLTDAVLNGDSQSFEKGLRNPDLNLKNMKDDCSNVYMDRLSTLAHKKQNNNNNEGTALTKDEVQLTINAANTEADKDFQQKRAIEKVNESLAKSDVEGTMSALKHPALGIPNLCDFASALYHEELGNMKQEKQGNLDLIEISGGCHVLSAISLINQAVSTGDPRTTFATLKQEEACLANLDDSCKAKYQQALEQAKSKSNNNCPFLTHFQIQQVVNEVNGEVMSENDRIVAVEKINEAIDSGNAAQTFATLKDSSAGLQDIDENQSSLYQLMLTAAKKAKRKEYGDPEVALWYQEIQTTVNQANVSAYDASKMSVGVAAINIGIERGEADSLLQCLSNPEVGLHSVTAECSKTYLAKLQDFWQRKKQAGECGSGWMMNRTREGYKFYFNVHSMEAGWERKEHMKKDNALLTRDEIQACVNDVTAAHDRHLLFKSNERFIIKLQALVRGHLARKRVETQRAFLYDQLPAIVRIQSWWRMIRARRQYMDKIRYLHGLEDHVVRIQALVRMFLAKRQHEKRLRYFKKNEWAAVKIQAFVRSRWAKQDYKLLMHGENPSISVVRRFVHLLDQGDLDYAEEIEVEKLRRDVVTEIRSNQALEEDLNQMDIKIGLLVKNRITIQDVVSQHRTLKKYRENSSSSLQKGLKALSKQSRERLEAYQHLFYLLQTNPSYLAKLIFEMPQNRTTKFMESVILTLYNYASNQREEYLLLRLFKSALEEEIHSKVDKMSDIVTGNPLVVKMIVSFNRNQRGQGALRELLHPLVKAVLDDRKLNINTNPVEVYKQWVNQMESDTGRASGLPYDVTVDQALRHAEVRERINASVQTLQAQTDKFLQAILANIEYIPYGMRYMARVMKDALREKFPHAPEKDILKIVGNLIYYRFINSAIVAPDAFDIIDIGANRGLTNDQRRNLGSIAKILQFAASNKGFGGDSAHLSHLNTYIMDAHNKFKRYFSRICEVDKPEVMFNMDQYTDVTRVTKPVIYISIGEMIDTHRNLVEHQDAVAPDPHDPLHEILEDLGDVPDIEDLIGEANIDEHGGKTSLAKTEISLTLSSKLDMLEEDNADINSLMIRTKQLLVEVIRCQREGESIPSLLANPCRAQEEATHQALCRERDRTLAVRNTPVKNGGGSKLARQQSMVGDMRMPLEAMKKKIEANLRQLERVGIVSHHDHYQMLLNSVVQDMRNQRVYRQQRRYELMRLKATLKSLAAKRTFYEEQIDYYNQYVKTCLQNLNTKRKSSHSKFGSKPKKENKPKHIKYSAARLHEKGIILEIEGLPTNQFKNVLFEISSTEDAGMFDVNAKFMGVPMDKVQLRFQDLLQLQYDGVAVMHMFDKAKVNVNLLIFLFNKKFYGK